MQRKWCTCLERRSLPVALIRSTCQSLSQDCTKSKSTHLEYGSDLPASLTGQITAIKLLIHAFYDEADPVRPTSSFNCESVERCQILFKIYVILPARLPKAQISCSKSFETLERRAIGFRKIGCSVKGSKNIVRSPKSLHTSYKGGSSNQQTI